MPITTDCCNDQEFLRKSQKRDFNLLPREMQTEYSVPIHTTSLCTYAGAIKFCA